MKKTLSLLPVACLALLLTACGSREIPDDALEDLLGVEALFTDRLAGITSVSDITHQPGEDGDTVTATVVSDNGFTVYTDQCTALAVYDEEKQNWVLESVTSVPAAVQAKKEPDLYVVSGLMKQDTYALLGIGGGGEESVLMPAYGVESSTLDNTNPVQPMARVGLDFEGRTYGWFTFHGGATLTLDYEPVHGSWTVRDLTPDEDFDVDCVLEGRTYRSEMFEDHVGGYTSYWQNYDWTVTFGEFDWRKGALTNCERLCYDHTENVEYIHETGLDYTIRNIEKNNPFNLDNPHYDWVLYMGEGGFYEDSFVMRSTDDFTADPLYMWESTEYDRDYVLECTLVS